VGASRARHFDVGDRQRIERARKNRSEGHLAER
jgi:hypothetical protein